MKYLKESHVLVFVRLQITFYVMLRRYLRKVKEIRLNGIRQTVAGLLASVLNSTNDFDEIYD